MASKSTHNIETDIYDITSDNLTDKLKEHMSEVIEYMRMKKCVNVKMITRIKELNPNISVIVTDLDDLDKLLGN